MQKSRWIFRGLAFLLCMAMIVGFLPAGIFGALAQVNATSAESDVQNADSDDLIQNGGFDGEALEWSFACGEQAEVKLEDGAVRLDCAVVLDENGKVAVDEEGNRLNRSNVIVTQTLDALSGFVAQQFDVYELKAQYKWISGDGQPYIGIWYFKDQPINKYCVGAASSYVADQSGEWVEIVVTAVVPIGANIAQIQFGTNSGTTVSCLFDDISMVKKGSYTFADSFDAFNSTGAISGPAGWLDNDTANANCVTCLSGESAYAGYALHFQNADGLWAESPAFDVKEGYDYTVEFMAMKTLNNGQFTGHVELIFLDANGKEVGSKERIVGKTFAEWTKESFIAIAPEGAVKAYFAFGCLTKAGAFAIDDLTVVESTGPSTYDPESEAPDLLPVYIPKLLNSGFEEGIKAWTVGSAAGGAIEVAANGGYSGKALLFTAAATMTEKATNYCNQSLAVEGIAALQLSVMSKRLSGEGGAYITMSFYDENGGLVGSNSGYTGLIAQDTEWAKTTLIQEVPEGAKTVKIEFGNYGGAVISFLVDNVVLEEYTGEEDQINPSVSKPYYEPDELNNSFEEVDGNGQPKVWWIGGGNGSFKVVQPDDAPHGKNVYEIKKPEGGSAALHSGRIAIEPGKTYNLKIMVKDMELGLRSIVGLYVYDQYGDVMADASKIVFTDGSGKWKMYIVTIVAPEGAATMEAEIWWSSTMWGTVQVDAMVLDEAEEELKAPYEPTPFVAPSIEEVLENVTDTYPRVFFSPEEAKEIKLRRFNTMKTKYGFTWNSKYEELLQMANTYMDVTEVEVAFNTGKTCWMDIYPVLKDPSDPSYDALYIENSIDDNGNYFELPHTGFGCLITGTLRDMMKTWSLAYIMTGKKVYAERAIDFAMQISDWKWWGDYEWTVAKKIEADASVAWMMEGMVAVFDMCHDQMTEEQIAKLKRNIIDKGLVPLYKQAKPDDTTNGNMMMVGGLLSGCAAIIDENNAEEIKPYLDHGLLCTHNALDNYAFSGNTEGHYYTDFGLETFVPSVGHIYRVTQLDGLVNHPFFSEILPYWTIMWAAPGSGTHPNYSDGGVRAYMKLPMAIMSKLNPDSLIDGFLISARGTGNIFNDLVYLTPDPQPTYLNEYAGVIEEIGYGALRTGFAGDDMLLTLKANDSQMGHNHYDQNSIQFNFGGSWLMTDPGVGSYYYADRTFWTHNGHSTILVDDTAQMVMGTGSTELIFNNNLYSYLVGSAPEAYGADYDGQLLDKFDRHAIQINHEDKSYYLVIDDLEASKDRVYSWQMYNGDRRRYSVDGVTTEELVPMAGHTVSMPLGGNVLNLTFIDDEKLVMNDKVYNAAGTNVGLAFTATTSAASKTHQFMTLISVADNADSNFVSFLTILDNRRFTVPEKLDDPTDLTWDSSMPIGQEIVKDNMIGTTNCLFFRGNKTGDYINIPFTIEEDGTYEITLRMGVSDGCCQVKATIDDTIESNVFDCSGLPEAIMGVSFGQLELAAGQHTIKLEVAGPGLHEKYADGWYLINANGLEIMRVGVEVPESKDLTVTEVIDNEEALAGMINYIDNKFDFVLWSRTDGAVTAGKLNTDGKQASVLGLVDGVITEGFAATGATTMTYDGKVLFLAEKKVDIVASNTGWQVIADEAQTVQLTAIAPELDYVITVNGETVDAKIENGLITLAIEAGETAIAVVVEEPEATEPSEPATEPEETEPTEAPTVAPTEPVDNAENDDAALWIIIAVIVLLLAGAATGLVLFLKKRKNV